MAQVVDSIRQLTSEVKALKEANAQKDEIIHRLKDAVEEQEAILQAKTTTEAPAPIVHIAKEPRGYKIRKLDEFSREKGTLKLFLTQMRLYLRNEQDNLPYKHDKVCAAATFLQREVYDQFDLYLTDQLQNAEDDRRAETTKMFKDYENFENALKNTFGDIDETRTAERQIEALRQRNSATRYTSEFR